MEPKELEKIIKIAKKHGAKSLEVNGVKLEFASAFDSGIPTEPKTVLPATGNTVGVPVTSTESHEQPSDSELLMWSSPYFDRMQADRKTSLEPEQVPS